MIRSRSTAIATIILFLATHSLLAQEASPLPPPVVIHLGDVNALVRDLASLTTQVDSRIDADALRALGARVGDPGLTAFGEGAGVVFVMENLDRMAVVAEVAGENAVAYRGSLMALGLRNQSEPTAPGPLVAASAPDLLDGPMVAAARRLLAGPGSGRIELDCQVPPLLAKYGPRLQLMSGSLPSFYRAIDPRLGGMGRLLEGEARVLLRLLEQVDSMGLTVGIDVAGITIVDRLRALPDTPLAEVVKACESPADLTLVDRLPAKGVVRGAARIPQAKLFEFMEGPLTNALRDMGVTDDRIDPLVDRLRQLVAPAGECFAMDAYGPTSVAEGAVVVESKDVEKSWAAFEAAAEMMTDDGLVAGLYAALSQKWQTSFTRDVRKIGDRPVHSLEMKLEYLEGGIVDPSMMPALPGLNEPWTLEMTSPDPGHLVWALGDVELASLLTGDAGAGEGIRAARSHDPGGFLYFDVKLSRLTRLLAPVLEAVPLEPTTIDAIARFLEGHRITGAAFSRQGEIRGELRVPGPLVMAIAGARRAGSPEEPSPELVKSHLSRLLAASQLYHADHKRWPTSYAELRQPRPYGTPYLNAIPIDPWSRKPYLWADGPDGPVFTSLGADQLPGGTGLEADIRSDRLDTPEAPGD